MQIEYDEDVFRPLAEYQGNSLRIGTESLGRRFRIIRDRGAGEMELALSRDVAMDLNMDFGAVRADIDLGGIRLTRLEINTGASQTQIDISEPNSEAMSRASMDVGAAEFTVRNLGNLNTEVIEIDAGIGEIDLDFTGDWRQNARVSVDMGLGSLVLRFPRGLGVRLVKDTFLTSLDSEGLVKRGDAYYSLDYDDAEYQITVDVDAAFGSIRVALGELTVVFELPESATRPTVALEHHFMGGKRDDRFAADLLSRRSRYPDRSRDRALDPRYGSLHRIRPCDLPVVQGRTHPAGRVGGSEGDRQA